MSKPLRQRLTYANVVATLALFVALGGSTAFAASQLKHNSVGTAQLKKSSVTSTKIKDGSVTTAKLAAGVSVSPTAAPSTSPTAASPSPPASGPVAEAVNAQTLGGLTVTQIEARSKLSCPPGTTLTGAVCIETALRPKEGMSLAILTCAEAGRRLPMIGELVGYEVSKFNSYPPSEWVEPETYNGTEYLGTEVTAAAPAFMSLGFPPASSTHLAFQCVTAPSN